MKKLYFQNAGGKKESKLTKRIRREQESEDEQVRAGRRKERDLLKPGAEAARGRRPPQMRQNMYGALAETERREGAVKGKWIKGGAKENKGKGGWQ